MADIAASTLRRVVKIPPEPHQRMFMPRIAIGDVLWLHGSRRSSLGGYIGQFSKTYSHYGGISPRGEVFTMLTEYTTHNT